MWGERQRGRGQSRLVVGSTRNRLLLRFLGREGLLEVLFVVPHVYHVAEVCVGAARLGRGVDGVSLPRRRVDDVSLSRAVAPMASLSRHRRGEGSQRRGTRTSTDATNSARYIFTRDVATGSNSEDR